MTIPTLKPGESLPPDAAFAYMIAKDGFYLKKRTDLYEATVRIPEVATLGEEKEVFRFAAPKIPAVLFSEILAFFGAVHLQHKSEAAVLLAFENGCWDVIVPDQVVTGASVKYKIPTGRRIAGSCHSHPGFSASFSRMDEKDEAEFDGIHIVVADTGFVRPGVSVAAVVSGRRIELDAEDVIEGYDCDSDFPEEWLGRVSPEAGQKLLFHDTADLARETDKALNPLCSTCARIALCDLDPPEAHEFCHFFDPTGSREDEG
jgi:hypothetical protein